MKQQKKLETPLLRGNHLYLYNLFNVYMYRYTYMYMHIINSVLGHGYSYFISTLHFCSAFSISLLLAILVVSFFVLVSQIILQ